VVVRHLIRTWWQAWVASPALGGLLLALAVSPPARAAEIAYKIQPIVKIGDQVGDAPVRTAITAVLIAGFNNSGELVLRTLTPSNQQTMVLYANGQFVPLAVAGRDGPAGKWPANSAFRPSLNARGNIVFGARGNWEGGRISTRLFFQDAQARTLNPVAPPGTPAVNGLTFQPGDSSVTPRLNNRDEIAFEAWVPDASGKAEPGVFLHNPNGRLQPVFLPDQTLPGGDAPSEYAGLLSLNDSSLVAFRVRRPGGGQAIGGYLWEQGTVTSAAVPGMELPGEARVIRVSGVWLNNQNRTLLMAIRTNTSPAQAGLYRFLNGQLAAVAVPGQEMPGGGKLATILEENPGTIAHGSNALYDVSLASEAGEHAFRGRLEDGTRAVYRLDADGRLSLVVKNGMITNLGTITSLPGATGIGLNDLGQVAMVVKIDRGPDTVVLLTPIAP
jgi:hypothetical protein